MTGPRSTPSSDDGYVAFDPQLFAEAKALLDAHPEQFAHRRIGAFRFDPVGFGQVPGASEAAARAAAWAERTRGEFGRVQAEIGDLAVGCGKARQMCLDADVMTAAVARLVAPSH